MSTGYPASTIRYILGSMTKGFGKYVGMNYVQYNAVRGNPRAAFPMPPHFPAKRLSIFIIRISRTSLPSCGCRLLLRSYVGRRKPHKQ